MQLQFIKFKLYLFKWELHTTVKIKKVLLHVFSMLVNIIHKLSVFI